MSDTKSYNPDAVVERYGFGPEFVPDFKALKGDTSDNIPGVPGIGDKGAAELIGAFGTVEAMIERFGELPAKYQKRIDGQQAQMLQSKYLATIVRDAPIEYDFQPFRDHRGGASGAVKLLESYEFRQHVRKAPSILSPYLGEGVEEASAPVAEVGDEAIEVRSSEARGYGDLAKFVDDRPFALVFGAPVRADLFEETERRAFVAVGDQVCECREIDALKLLEDLPNLATLHDAKPVYKR